MIQRMLRVDNWLDVAPLANVEGDHSFLFMKKILMKIFFFFGKIWKSWIFFMELKILIDDFFFFLKILEILNFFMELKFLIDDFFFFLKTLEILNFFKELKILNFFFYFERNLRSTSLMPLVPRPFFKILSLFFFLKYEDLFIIKKVKKMKMKME